MVMKLYITGIEAIGKFIDALTSRQADQFIVVRTDEYQSYEPSDKRGFIVEIYDNENHYIEQWDLNDKLYTLQEAKEQLGIEELGTEEQHVKNFFGVHDGTSSTHED